MLKKTLLVQTEKHSLLVDFGAPWNIKGSLQISRIWHTVKKKYVTCQEGLEQAEAHADNKQNHRQTSIPTTKTLHHPHWRPPPPSEPNHHQQTSNANTITSPPPFSESNYHRLSQTLSIPESDVTE
jgi:hypothetical protein